MLGPWQDPSYGITVRLEDVRAADVATRDGQIVAVLVALFAVIVNLIGTL